MQKPSAAIGAVRDETLLYEQKGRHVAVVVGTPPWYAWLETATTFTFECEAGQFTAHKARAGNRRGGWYWRAYRRQQGKLSRCYLGVSTNLTLPCLRGAARRLAAHAEGASTREAAAARRHTSQAKALHDLPAPIPILHTKCTIPRLPVQHVPRASLVALVERATAGPVTLVSAPAGSGKTTLLAEWARATAMPVAWLSLEAADSEPERFLAYLLAALQTLDERIGLQARALVAGGPAPDLESVQSTLVNELASYLVADAALVLDDSHVLDGEAVHAALIFLLDHLPERLHLVIGTRVDPPFPLARLRARGHLGEIRTDALRFVAAEMKAFLREMDLDLAEEALDSLEEQTEGWIAGVQLAALALRGRDDHEAFLSGFRGNHRFIQEYVSEEILARQTPRVRTFLLQTSILERLSGSLCDDVTQQVGGQTMLEELRKANLFVSALDETGEWYRYHALFAESLRHLQLQQEPELLPELYIRAGDWYEARGMLVEACEYALLAKDYERAAPLIERLVSTLIGRVQFPLLHRWLDQLPPKVIASRPLLGVAATWAALIDDGEHSDLWAQKITQLHQRFQEHLEDVDPAEWVEAQAHLNFIRLVHAIGKNDATRALEIAQQTFQTIPEHARHLRSLASICLSLARATTHRVAGDYAAAERELIEAAPQPGTTSFHFLNLIGASTLAEIYEAQGNVQKLSQLYQGLLQFAHAYEEAPPELSVWISVGYSKLFLDLYRLDEAENMLQRALAAEQKTQLKDLTLACRFVQLWISQARGSEDKTRELLQKLEKPLSGISLAQPVASFDALWWVGLLLSQDKLDEAARWLSACGLSHDDPFTEPPDNDFSFVKYATLARVLIALGRRSPRERYLSQALALLERLYKMYEPVEFHGRVAEICVLKSLALQARGETRAALVTLGQALRLAERPGYVRMFAAEGQPMEQLFAHVAPYVTVSPAYLQRLQEALVSTLHDSSDRRRAVAHPSGVDPLSAREREVLVLLAVGSSNQEIADQLVVSLNTAKRHVKHILAKLTASNRTQAVARARELQLL